MGSIQFDKDLIDKAFWLRLFVIVIGILVLFISFFVDISVTTDFQIIFFYLTTPVYSVSLAIVVILEVFGILGDYSYPILTYVTLLGIFLFAVTAFLTLFNLIFFYFVFSLAAFPMIAFCVVNSVVLIVCIYIDSEEWVLSSDSSDDEAHAGPPEEELAKVDETGKQKEKVKEKKRGKGKDKGKEKEEK